MSKDYFSHDANARNDLKILAMRSEYGAEGYGWYWMIVEMLREENDYHLKINKYIYDALALQLQCDASTAEKFILDCINKYELFKSDGEKIWSDSLLKRMNVMNEKSAKARKAAYSRWNKENNADAMQTHSESNAIKLNENKINIEDDDEDARAREGKVFKFFNENLGPITPFQQEVVSQYLDEGIEPEMIIAVMQDSVGKDDRWSWTKTVLCNAATQNIKTFDQYKANKAKKKNYKSRDKPGQNNDSLDHEAAKYEAAKNSKYGW